MRELNSQAERDKRGRGWALAIMVTLGFFPWWVTIAMLGINCEGADPESGVCGATSASTAFVLLLALQMPTIISWIVARFRNDWRWFGWLAWSVLGINILIAVLAMLWASGDLG
jgi:hypothetical protein